MEHEKGVTMSENFSGELHRGGENGQTYVHHVVKYNKRCPFSLRFIPQSYLPNGSISAKEVIQVFTSNSVV